MIPRIRVQAAEFDVGAEYATLTGAAPDAGGVGCFVGRVRGGGGLRALTLEHYPGMTEQAVATLVQAAGERWPLLGCTVIHRIGVLAVGAPIVLVLAAAAHRSAALEATGFLIDWLKTEAPFWKRESFENGTERWVEPVAADDAARRRWDHAGSVRRQTAS